MKKFFIIVLCLSVIFPSASFANTKKTTVKPCKPGSVKFDSKFNHVCLKNKTWKKTLIAKPIPPAINNSNSEQGADLNKKNTNPSTEISKVQTPIEVKPEPTPIIVVPPVPFSIDNLSLESVYSKSRESIESSISKSTYTLDGIIFHVGPGISEEKINIEKNSIERAAKLWSNIYKPNGKTHFVFYDFNSLSWAKSKLSSIDSWAVIRGEATCSLAYCGNATASLFGNDVSIVQQGIHGGLRNRQTSPHEYTHLAQATADKTYWSTAPFWLVEGMASFYGEAIGYAPFDTKGLTRDEHHFGTAEGFYKNTGKTFKEILQKNDVENTKEIMKTIEFPTPRYNPTSQTIGYLLGAYVTEVLVAVYGHESFEKFIVSFGTSKNWEVNFKNSFGISKDDFYSKITPYLAEVSKRF
jgi:hypothetical protein